MREVTGTTYHETGYRGDLSRERLQEQPIVGEIRGTAYHKRGYRDHSNRPWSYHSFNLLNKIFILFGQVMTCIKCMISTFVICPVHIYKSLVKIWFSK